MTEGFSGLEIAATAIFMAVWVVLFVRHTVTHRPAPLEDEDFAGSVGEIEVGTVRVAGGRELVSIAVRVGRQDTRVTGCLLPAQARRLAELLRIAAAPGRNLVQARWNFRRGRKAPSNPA